MELRYYVLICAKTRMSETEYPAVFLKYNAQLIRINLIFFIPIELSVHTLTTKH